MSIHHEVTVHCDGCGHWEQGNPGGRSSSQITRQRRRDGWLIWRAWGDAGSWLHLCPRCARDSEARDRVQETLSGIPIPAPADLVCRPGEQP